MKTTNNLLLLAPAAILAMSMSASADLSRVQLDARANFSTFAPTDDLSEGSSKINHLEVIGGIMITDGVKAVLRMELEDSDLSDFEIEDVIREAKIEIRTHELPGNKGRAVRAYISQIDIGVIQAAYGTKVSQNTAARTTQRFFDLLEGQEGVVGLTMTLNTDQLQLVDQAKVSVYNTGSGDGIDTDGEMAVSAQVSKQIGNFRAEFAALWRDDREELAADFGLFYEVNEKIQVWGGLHKFDETASAETGYTVGASYQLPKGSVFVEMQADDNDNDTIVAGYNLPEEILPRGMKVVTWVSKASEDDDAKVGMDVQLMYSNMAKKDLEY